MKAEAEQKRRVEMIAKIEPRDRGEEKAGNCEILGKADKPLNGAFCEPAQPDHEVARADNHEYRQNDIQKRTQ